MSQEQKKRTLGWKVLAKTTVYELMGKKTANELYLNLKVENSQAIHRKQYDAVILDTNIPKEIAFFLNSTQKLLQFLSKPDNYSIIHRQGIIVLKIPVATSEGEQKHQINIKLHEKENNQNKMVEALDELRKKINKMKTHKKVSNISRSSSETANALDSKTIKCLKCGTEEKMIDEKDQIYEDVKKSIKMIREELRKEINMHVQDRMVTIRAEIIEEMGEYIEEMKNVMKRQIKEEIRQQFWDTNSQNENKGELLFNMLRNKISDKLGQKGDCIIQGNDGNQPQQPQNPEKIQGQEDAQSPKDTDNIFKKIQSSQPINNQALSGMKGPQESLNKITEDLAHFMSHKQQVQHFEHRILQDSLIKLRDENSQIFKWRQDYSQWNSQWTSQIESESEISSQQNFRKLTEEVSDSSEGESNDDSVQRIFKKKTGKNLYSNRNKHILIDPYSFQIHKNKSQKINSQKECFLAEELNVFNRNDQDD